MARLLLVNPLVLAEQPEEREAASPYFPLGLLYLAAYAREAGHHVAVFDGTFVPDRSAFLTALDAERPDVVGISAVQPTRNATFYFAAAAAARGLPVLVGGPDPTAEPERYLSSPDVSVVVHHEGEQTIAALLDRWDAGEFEPDALASEPGVAVRTGDGVVVTEARAPIEDLDALPHPARDLIDLERYLDAWDEASGYRSVTIATSRGCPRDCQWCREGVHGAGFRQRSPASVAAEVADIAERHAVGRIRLVDDVDGLDRTWLEAWADALTEVGSPVPYEALYDLERTDLPLLEVQDTL